MEFEPTSKRVVVPYFSFYHITKFPKCWSNRMVVFIIYKLGGRTDEHCGPYCFGLAPCLKTPTGGHRCQRAGSPPPPSPSPTYKRSRQPKLPPLFVAFPQSRGKPPFHPAIWQFLPHSKSPWLCGCFAPVIPIIGHLLRRPPLMVTSSPSCLSSPTKCPNRHFMSPSHQCR
jgi:hypothetical protein